MEPSDECLLDSDATHCGRKPGTTGTTRHEQSHDGDAGGGDKRTLGNSTTR